MWRNTGTNIGGGLALGPDGLKHIGIDRTIIAGSLEGSAIYSGGQGILTLSCTDLWGNEGGDWTLYIEDQLGLRGNMSADPMFCHPDSSELWLQPGSPCAPPNPICHWIGAWGVGCDPVAAPTTAGDRPFTLTARPNPFSRGTLLSWDSPTGIPRLTDAVESSLDVYDVEGRHVRNLWRGSETEDLRTATWSGEGSGGRPAPNGVYLVVLRRDGQTAARHIVLAR
jgi:hypothetical protein